MHYFISLQIEGERWNFGGDYPDLEAFICEARYAYGRVVKELIQKKYQARDRGITIDEETRAWAQPWTANV